MDKLSFMTFMCPQWTVEQIVAGAQQHGYAGVEPRVKDKQAHGIEPEATAGERRRIRKVFEDAGVAISCVATSCRFATGLPESRQEHLDDARRHIDLAADLGSSRIRVFCGTPPEGWPREVVIPAVAEQLAELGPYAAERGVTVCLETHDYFRPGSSVGAALAQANHPAIAANWDVQHPYNFGEHPAATWSHLQGRVAHTHFHDWRPGEGLGLVELETGIAPLRHFLYFLKESGYDGYLSAEYWQQLGEPEVALPSYANGMRRLLAGMW